MKKILSLSFLMMSFCSYSQLLGKKSDSILLDLKISGSAGKYSGNSFGNAGLGYQLHLSPKKIANALTLNQDLYFLGLRAGGENLQYNVQLKTALLANITRDFSFGYVNVIGGSRGKFLDHGYRLRFSRQLKVNSDTNIESLRLVLDLERFDGIDWRPEVFNVGVIINPFAYPVDGLFGDL